MSIERDRYLSFAFAAADLLLELGADGNIQFAAGSAQALTGKSDSDLIGMQFTELFAASERETAERVLSQLDERQLIGPTQLELNHEQRPISMRAIRALDDGLTRATLSKMPPGTVAGSGLRDAASGLLVRESFVEMAERAPRRIQKNGGAART